MRWWLVAMLTGTVASLSGCGAAANASITRTMPDGDGVVVGGIDGCSALAIARNPGFVAGTVTVLRGTVALLPEGHGSFAQVLPTDAVATETVARHQRYWFALPPGQYVLTARYSERSNVTPWIPVTLRRGKTTIQSIPDECI